MKSQNLNMLKYDEEYLNETQALGVSSISSTSRLMNKEKKKQRVHSMDITSTYKKSKKEKMKRGYYEITEILGFGGFGEVRLAKHLLTGDKVAIKIINKEKLKNENATVSKEKEDNVNESDSLYEKFNNEINILKILQHPSIIKLIEIIESKTSFYLVMEYCENKDIYEYIVDNDKLSENEAGLFFLQILDGVVYCNNTHNLAHRDLKLENILLTNDNKVKLTDFGFAKYFEKLNNKKNEVNEENRDNSNNKSNTTSDNSNRNNLLETPCGTLSYACPEKLKGEKYCPEKSEVWSLGVVLYTLYTGYLPFPVFEVNPDSYLNKILSGSPVFEENFPNELKQLILRMLDTNQVTRISLDDILDDNWVRKMKKKHNFIYKYCDRERVNSTNKHINKEALSQAVVYIYENEINKISCEQDRSLFIEEKFSLLKERVESAKFDSLSGVYNLIKDKEAYKNKFLNKQESECLGENEKNDDINLDNSVVINIDCIEENKDTNYASAYIDSIDICNKNRSIVRGKNNDILISNDNSNKGIDLNNNESNINNHKDTDLDQNNSNSKQLQFEINSGNNDFQSSNINNVEDNNNDKYKHISNSHITSPITLNMKVSLKETDSILNNKNKTNDLSNNNHLEDLQYKHSKRSHSYSDKFNKNKEFDFSSNLLIIDNSKSVIKEISNIRNNRLLNRSSLKVPNINESFDIKFIEAYLDNCSKHFTQSFYKNIKNNKNSTETNKNEVYSSRKIKRHPITKTLYSNRKDSKLKSKENINKLSSNNNSSKKKYNSNSNLEKSEDKENKKETKILIGNEYENNKDLRTSYFNNINITSKNDNNSHKLSEVSTQMNSRKITDNFGLSSNNKSNKLKNNSDDTTINYIHNTNKKYNNIPYTVFQENLNFNSNNNNNDNIKYVKIAKSKQMSLDYSNITSGKDNKHLLLKHPFNCFSQVSPLQSGHSKIENKAITNKRFSLNYNSIAIRNKNSKTHKSINFNSNLKRNYANSNANNDRKDKNGNITNKEIFLNTIIIENEQLDSFLNSLKINFRKSNINYVIIKNYLDSSSSNNKYNTNNATDTSNTTNATGIINFKLTKNDNVFSFFINQSSSTQFSLSLNLLKGKEESRESALVKNKISKAIECFRK